MRVATDCQIEGSKNEGQHEDAQCPSNNHVDDSFSHGEMNVFPYNFFWIRGLLDISVASVAKILVEGINGDIRILFEDILLIGLGIEDNDSHFAMEDIQLDVFVSLVCRLDDFFVDYQDLLVEGFENWVFCIDLLFSLIEGTKFVKQFFTLMR